jgi:hypothetical protein
LQTIRKALICRKQSNGASRQWGKQAMGKQAMGQAGNGQAKQWGKQNNGASKTMGQAPLLVEYTDVLPTMGLAPLPHCLIAPLPFLPPLPDLSHCFAIRKNTINHI